MITLLTGWFAKPAIRYGAIALAAALLFGAGVLVYNQILDRGKREGEGLVIGKVQTETIKATEKARETREKAEDEVRRTPYDSNVDGLR